MPMVPGAAGPDSFAIPTVSPQARMASLDPTAGTEGMQAVARLGDTMGAAQKQTSQTVLDLQQLTDQTDIANKVNAYQKAANANYEPGGLFTLQGKNAIDAYPQAVKNLEDTRSSLIGSAKNPYEQQVLASSLNEQQQREFRSMGSFYADTVRQYHDDSLSALADTATQTGALNYNNPAAIQTSIDTVQHTATLQAQTRGYNPVMSNQYVLQATSQTASSIVDAALVHDPSLASTYLTKLKPYFDPSTYMEESNRVRQAVLPGAADEVAGSVLGQNATVVPQDVMDQIGENESGNKPGLTSPTGALGQYQIEPDTGEQAAKEIGVPWDPQRALNDPTYGRLIATRVMDDNLKTFQGSKYQYPAALAAYNAGPNNPGVLHLAQTGDPSQLPAQTQAYLKEFNLNDASVPVGDVGQSVAQQGENLQALMQQGGEALSARFPDQPNAYDMGSQAVFSHYVKAQAAYNDQQSAATTTVLNAIDSNHIASAGDLIKLGGAPAQAWFSMSPERQQGAMALMAKNQPGADTSYTPQKEQTYNNLVGLSVTNPDAFLHTNLMNPSIVNSLTPDLLTSLINRKASMAKGQNRGPSPSQINGVVSYLTPQFTAAGINMKDKTDPNTLQMTGALTQLVEDYANKHDGEMPPIAEMKKMGDQLITQGYSGTGGIFFGAKNESFYQAYGQNGVIDPKFTAKIPEAKLAQINAAWQQATGRLPTLREATAFYIAHIDDQASPSVATPGVRAPGIAQ